MAADLTSAAPTGSAGNTLAGKRVLITGAAGFIGSHVTRLVAGLGADTHALTSTVSSVYPQRLADLRDRITLHEGNLADRSAMDNIVRAARPQVVLHLGAYTHVGKSWQRVDECIQTNVQGTVNLLQALDGTGYERFVYTGTSEIYGDVPVPFTETDMVNPISPYSVSKYAGERYCRMFHQGRGWPIVMVRPFNAFGPWQSPDRVIPEIIVRGLTKQPLRMTQGRQTREFNYVEDLAVGFVAAATVPGIEGEILNLGCGEDISMRDLAVLVLELMGDPIAPEFGAIPDRPTEIWQMVSNATKACELLGYEPQVGLRAGLERTIAWYRSQLDHPGSSFV